MVRIIGYLRVSTTDQELQKNEHDILKFANSKGFSGKVEFVSEKVSGLKSWRNRKLFQIASELKAGDILLVPELSRLGRSLADILDILNFLSQKKIAIYSVKENFQLNSQTLQNKILRTMLALFSEIERDLISARTKEGLQAAKAKGKQLGRPRGPGRSKLDPNKPEILALLRNGATKIFVAERFNTTSANLINWLKINDLLDQAKPRP